MNNREQYKRIAELFGKRSHFIFFQGMCFAYIWYEYYSRVIFLCRSSAVVTGRLSVCMS